MFTMPMVSHSIDTIRQRAPLQSMHSQSVGSGIPQNCKLGLVDVDHDAGKHFDVGQPSLMDDGIIDRPNPTAYITQKRENL